MSAQDMWDLLSSQERTDALSAENKYFASQALGHSPSDEEAVVHYFKYAHPGLIMTIHVYVVSEADQQSQQATAA